MSRKFLQDFYEWYRDGDVGVNKQQQQQQRYYNQYNLTNERRLEPDTMASILLIEKRAWSVTRRYWTSHTVLSSTDADMDVIDMSLTRLFEYEEVQIQINSTNITSSNDTALDGTNTAMTNTNGTMPATEVVIIEEPNPKSKKTTIKKKVALMPALSPRKHLPRCLEPHRAIWSKHKQQLEDDDNNSYNATDSNKDFDDMFHWNFFVYDLCPDSEVFPCKEGQLEAMASKDTYLRGRAGVMDPKDT